MSSRRRMLRKSEIKSLLAELSQFKDVLSFDERNTKLEVVEVGDQRIFLFDGKPFLFGAEGKLFPTLFFEPYIFSAPKIVVDMGAVPHVCNGADVMAPGVRNVSGIFSEGAFVVVTDELHRKSIALGRALFNSELLAKTSRGAVVEILHYVGDEIYNISKTI